MSRVLLIQSSVLPLATRSLDRFPKSEKHSALLTNQRNRGSWGCQPSPWRGETGVFTIHHEVRELTSPQFARKGASRDRLQIHASRKEDRESLDSSLDVAVDGALSHLESYRLSVARHPPGWRLGLHPCWHIHDHDDVRDVCDMYGARKR